MGQLLRNGRAELYAACRDTIQANIAKTEAEIAARMDAIASLETRLADALAEEKWALEVLAKAADAEDPDAVLAAAEREREALLAAVPCSEPGENPGDAGPTKNADKKPAGFGEK